VQYSDAVFYADQVTYLHWECTVTVDLINIFGNGTSRSRQETDWKLSGLS